MTLTSFTRKLNALRAENGQKPLTRAGVQYRITQLIERGTLIESDVRTRRATFEVHLPKSLTSKDTLLTLKPKGTFEWHLSEKLIITVANFEPKPFRNRQGIGRPRKEGKQ